MERFLIVCAGGAVGSGARYLVSLWAGQRLGTGFPYGTLIVNVVGSFAIALVLEVSIRIASFPPGLRLALTTGLLGGFTTYSSFNYETTALLTSGGTTRAFVNIAATVIGCLVAGFAGLWLARRLS